MGLVQEQAGDALQGVHCHQEDHLAVFLLPEMSAMARSNPGSLGARSRRGGSEAGPPLSALPYTRSPATGACSPQAWRPPGAAWALGRRRRPRSPCTRTSPAPRCVALGPVPPRLAAAARAPMCCNTNQIQSWARARRLRGRWGCPGGSGASNDPSTGRRGALNEGLRPRLTTRRAPETGCAYSVQPPESSKMARPTKAQS